MMPSLAAAAMQAVFKGDDAQLAYVHALEARVDALETALGVKDAAHFPRRLSPVQRVILGMLIRRDGVTMGQIASALYGHVLEQPDDPYRTIRVQVCGLRKRLLPDAIEIETARGGHGGNEATAYRLPPEGKRKIAQIMTEYRS